MRKIQFFVYTLSVCLGFLPAFALNFDSSIQKQLVIVDSVQEYNLNPHTATYASEAQIINGLFEGLFVYHPITCEPVAALAHSYSVSKDGLTWTFAIRTNAHFSNGEKINAHTMRQSLLTLLNPKTNAPYASLLDCISGAETYREAKSTDVFTVGIKAPDEYTLELSLTSPAAHLPSVLAHTAFAAVHTDPSVFSGAFVIDSRSETEIILKKNTAYWDTASVALPSIRFVQIDDETEATYWYNIGKAHWLMASTDYKKLLAQDTILLAPQFSTEYLFFNTTEFPADNENLRKALIKAAPISDLRKNNLIPATTLVFPLTGYPKVQGIEAQDLAEAQILLEKAGYGEKSGKKAEIVLHIPDFPSYKTQMQVLIDAWTKMGISVRVELSSPSRYLDDIQLSSAHVFSYTWIGDFADPLAFLELFRGSSTLNEAHWKNAAFDALLAEAALISDTKKRYEKLAEAEKLLLDSGVILPISHTVSVNTIDLNEIAGWYDNALNMHPLKNLYFTPAKAISNIAMNNQSK